MRGTLLVATVISVTATAVGWAADADTEKELARLSRRIDDAYVKADTTFLANVLADDWMRINSKGIVQDKDSLLKELKEGFTKFNAMDASEVKVRVYGDTAVVTGRYLAEYQVRGREGATVLDVGRFGRVFVRRDGKWQYVHSQSTLVLAELPGSGPRPK
jgi:ketosteroid isomerase-like protein